MIDMKQVNHAYNRPVFPELCSAEQQCSVRCEWAFH
jgi:hypothetical protein